MLTRIGFCAVLLLACGIGLRADTSFMLTLLPASSDFDEAFGTINLATGAYTPIVADYGSSVSLSGLAVYNGVLYSADLDKASTDLYTVNTSTGALTEVASLGISDVADVASTPTTLYALDESGNLWSFSTDGTATEIGSTGLTFSSGNYTLSVNSGTLYLTSDHGGDPDEDDLYVVNTSTGALTLIGPTSDYNFDGAVSTGGALYAVSTDCCSSISTNSSVNVMTLDTTTGAATLVAAITDPSVFGAVGLAPDPLPGGTPEPATFLLAGSALAAFAVLRRRAAGK